MADHTLVAKTVKNRLIYTGATVAATHNTTEKTSTVFTVDKGTPITLVVTVTTLTNVGSTMFLEGSIDGTNFTKLLTIEADGDNNSTTADLTTANAKLTISKTHVPATSGDFPYYRVATDAAGSTGACVLVGTVLIG